MATCKSYRDTTGYRDSVSYFYPEKFVYPSRKRQSQAVKHNLPWVTTFDVYFQMSLQERNRRRLELDSLVSDGSDGTCGANYEAQQAPLAYAILAPVDALVRRSNLPSRVWYMRLVCALSSCICTAGAVSLLAKRLNLPPIAGHCVIFVVLSSQMFYATTAHIANDWLAVPLMVLLFERLIAAWENPALGVMASLAATLADGLLTKSYFIALIPYIVIVLGVLLLRRRLLLRPLLTFSAVLFALAGPWYARNVLLYHNFTGMQETMGGVQLSALVAYGTHLPWIRAGWGLLLGTIWTGNNSFATFSRWTLVMLLLPYSVAAISWVYRYVRRSLATSELLVVGGLLTYGVALAYSAALTYWSSGGTEFAPEPWYAEAVAPILVTVLFCELARYRFYSLLS